MTLPIRVLNVSKHHWMVEWIPISYLKLLTTIQFNNSRTFLWSEGYQIMAICRCYYQKETHLEIGDLWLNKTLRGKRDDMGEKYSEVFLTSVIEKIWISYPNALLLTLKVAATNISAIMLYEKMGFKKVVTIQVPELNIKSGFLMVKKKNY